MLAEATPAFDKAFGNGARLGTAIESCNDGVMSTAVCLVLQLLTCVNDWIDLLALYVYLYSDVHLVVDGDVQSRLFGCSLTS